MSKTDNLQDDIKKLIAMADDLRERCVANLDYELACTSAAIKLIAAERARQVDEEGWTSRHDDIEVDGELAAAAAYSNG